MPRTPSRSANPPSPSPVPSPRCSTGQPPGSGGGEDQQLPLFSPASLHGIRSAAQAESSHPDLTLTVYGAAKVGDLGARPEPIAPAYKIRPTPARLASLMVDILGIKEGMSVYDPACGSCGLLIAAAERLYRAGADNRSLNLYGQALDQEMARMAVQTLGASNLENIHIVGGDVLTNPQHLASPGELKRFDAVLTNPPFSQRSWGLTDWRRGDQFGRCTYGCPPRSNADFAFVLHAVASLNERGRAVMVLPPGVLYRRGAEGRIREVLIRENLVDAIIGLPSKLFAGTTTPVVLLVLDRNRPPSRQGRVLVVDGTSDFLPQGRQNVLSEEQCARLTNAVRRYTDEDGFCRVVSMSEMAANGFDMSLARYLQPSPAPAVRRPPRSSNSRAGANPALEAARAALVHAQVLKARRASELFGGGTAGVDTQTTWVGELPAHWALLQILDFLEVPLQNGLFFSKNKGTFLLEQVGQTSIISSGLVNLRAAKQNSALVPPREMNRLLPGDLLLKRVHANINEVATAALVAMEPNRLLFCESSIVRLRVRRDLILPEILLAWLHHAPIRSVIAAALRRSVQASINHDAVLSLPCPYIPDPQERKAINAELSVLTQAIHAANDRLAFIEAHGYDAGG